MSSRPREESQVWVGGRKAVRNGMELRGHVSHQTRLRSCELRERDSEPVATVKLLMAKVRAKGKT